MYAAASGLCLRVCISVVAAAINKNVTYYLQ